MSRPCVNAALLGERFILLEFDALVADMEGTMRSIAERIGIDWHPVLAQQNFNGMDMRPNNSFQSAAKERRSSALSAQDVARISEGPMMIAYRSD